MKKKVFCFIVIIAIIVVAGWNMSLGSKTEMLSNIAFSNVEALARGEDNDDCSGGNPGLNCRIWNVTHTVTMVNGVASTTCSCSTGGSYTCPCG